METAEETGAAAALKELAVGEPGASISGPGSYDKDRVYDLNEEGGDDDTVVVVNRRVVLTETTSKMRYMGGSDENGSENIVQENDNRRVSAEKSEFNGNGNGISLVVDVHGPLDGADENDAEKKFGAPDVEISYARKGDDVVASFGEVIKSHRSIAEEKKENGSVVDNWAKVGKDFAVDDDDDGEIVGDKKHGFAVGDFVWGKIKSHPWWPGQIYDPSDASEFASKFKREDRLLVAYFGDGSCAWCFPSQLVEFAEYFEEMSKQSTSKSLDNAVKKALDEIGRRAELNMICSCVPEGKRAGLTRPHAVNAGVKPGVLVPEGDVDRLQIPRCEPAEVLEYVRRLGQAGFATNMLKLVLVKSWLSAFYRVRRGCRLPTYYEPEEIEGLEDRSIDMGLNGNDFGVPIEVPIEGPLKEDQLSSPKAGPFKGPMLSDEQLNGSRKEKSVAELMREDTVVKPKSRRKSENEEHMREDTGVKPKSRRKSKNEEVTPSTSAKKMKKAENGALTESTNLQASTSRMERGRKKKIEISISPGTAVNKGMQPENKANKIISSNKRRKNKDSGGDLEGENGGGIKSTDPQASIAGRKRGRKKRIEISISPGTAVNAVVQPEYKVKKRTSSNKRKRNKGPAGDMEDEAKEESEKNLMSRERKKSKYLSPPYTSHSWRGGKSITKGELETESEKITKVSRAGERMTRASGQLFMSPPILKSNSEKSDVKMAEGHSSRVQKSGASPQTVKKKQKKIINSMDVNASVPEVLAEVQSAGVDLMALQNGSVEIIKGFVTAFRSSMYLNGSNFKSYHKQRKSPVPTSGKVGNEVNQASTASPQPSSHNVKIETPRSRVTKLKRAARAAATNKKEVDKRASPVSLIISFRPGASLPSKDEIIEIFKNYGNVNEDETKVLLDSNCAEVAYINISDAEEAFRESIKQSPFGSSSAGYRLRYASAAARALESGRKNSMSPKKRTRKNVVGFEQTNDEISQVGSIMMKLDVLRLMLEMCNGKVSGKEKSRLEDEIRSLLQRASALDVKTSC